MAELKLPTKPVENWEQIRDDWVRTVERLVADVESWCRARDWPTRRIEKRIEEKRLGEYAVPALVFQVTFVKLMLEPIARFVSEALGLVDLYVMPQYDNVASLFLRADGWHIHYTVTGDKIPPDVRQADPSLLAADVTEPFTAETFARVIGLMI